MHKLSALLLALLLLVSLAACGSNNDSSSAPVSFAEGEQTASSTSSDSAADVTTTTSEKSTTSAHDRSTTTDGKGQTISKTTTSTAPVVTYEKPVTINTAVLYNKQTSAFDSQAESMRQTVLNAKDTLKPSGNGKTYYISYRGNDEADGLSPATAWKSPAKAANKLNFRAGDVVLFERGGVYRDVGIEVQSGVSYGAYGTGPKPQLYGGDKNYADESLWQKTSVTNVWRTKFTQVKGSTASTIEDVGNIVFDYGKICASDNKRLSSSKLQADYDFYYDAKNDYVYLYLSKGNPGKLHESIELAPNEHIIRIPYGATNVVIENLCIKYTAAHGVSCSNPSNVTVRGCEIGYIGGGLLTSTVRFGNGIEFYGITNNCTAENNWIYQCFDAGYTNQGENCWQSNIRVKNNLIEYCVYNIEVWTTETIGKGGMKNCTFSDNILRFAGYGFGTNARYGSSTGFVGNISYYDNIVPSENTVIQNNILDCSYRYLVSISYPNDTQGRGPTITGNIWNQKPFKNDDTTACIDRLLISGKAETLKCGTLDEMKASVAKVDKAPKAITLEK